MTYQQYKDELHCLTHIERDLKLAIDAIWAVQAGDTWRASRDWVPNNGDLTTICTAIHERPYARRNSIRKDIARLRTYRSSLAYWFWTSRVGNPPGLR